MVLFTIILVSNRNENSTLVNVTTISKPNSFNNKKYPYPVWKYKKNLDYSHLWTHSNEKNNGLINRKKIMKKYVKHQRSKPLKFSFIGIGTYCIFANDLDSIQRSVIWSPQTEKKLQTISPYIDKIKHKNIKKL